MNTEFKKIFLSVLISGTITFSKINAQTHGAGAINSNLSVGTSGTNHCFIGAGAGQFNTTGSYNSFFGDNAGNANTTGSYNTFTGFQAGKTSIVGNRNTFNGYQAGYYNGSSQYLAGHDHTFIGYKAGYSCGTNDVEGVTVRNTFVGSVSGYSNTIGHKNTFVGYSSGYYNTTGYENTMIGDAAGVNNTSGAYNTFIGESSGSQNTTGTYNTYLGNSSGVYNSTGSYNTIVGEQAGASSPGNNYSDNSLFGFKAGFQLTSGTVNSFFGKQAGYSNTTASYNTFIGNGAGYATNTGYSNTASGFNSMVANTTGISNCTYGTNSAVSQTTASYNCAFGYGSLYNGTGGYNSAFGSNAGGLYSTGTNNTYIGNGADAGASITNSTVLGNTAIVNASNKVVIGNTSVTVIGGQVGWSVLSDARFKTNITENVKGLEFIKRLRPVNYQFKTDEFDQFLMKNMTDSAKAARIQGVDYTASMSIIHTGFLAQEVEQAAITSGYIFDGVHVPVNDDDNYSLAYSQFVVPLVKSVQELSKITDSLNTTITNQDSINNFLQNEINELTNMINSCCSNINDSGRQTTITNQEHSNQNSGAVNVTLSNSKTIILDQNIPNPFGEQTVINYYLPDDTGKAQILFYNADGKLIQSVELTGKGQGSLKVLANDLTNGIYTYSLLIDGKVVETKKMVKQ
jgi:trimeric autotransporter adhesin